MMIVRRVVSLLLLLLVASTVHAQKKEFPESPPKLKEAEAQGLKRLSADELKGFFPGKVGAKRQRGGRITRTYKPDGTLEVSGHETFTGSWWIDEKRGVYCDRLTGAKKVQVERCFAVFSAGDGTHYFDYDISDGLQTLTWRRAPASK